MRVLRTHLATVAVAVLVVGCGGGEPRPAPSSGADSPGAGRPPVTLGTKNFTEQFILGELYAQALRAKGWTVTVKADIGSTELTDRALSSGSIDAYPEYTGTILSVVADEQRSPSTARATYARARAFERRRGLELLAPTPFEDRDAIAVTEAFAKRNGDLRTLPDLRRLGGRVTLGAAPEFRTRFAGYKGLKTVYGLRRLRFRPLEIGEVYGRLAAGDIQAGDVFTTDGQLATGRYRLLEDPKALFGFQHVAPVVSRDVLRRQGPAFAKTLNAVSARLTTEAMQTMNASAQAAGGRPALVARDFLRTEGLL